MLSSGTTHARLRQGEKFEIIYRHVSDGGEQNVLKIIFHRHFLESEMCKRNVRNNV